ncbi:MAG: stress response translation initiation inhibitor YciH [Gammaproteobacteria bacterium]|nr:MAG: stress response translation initiation inhibitor YciH [Gammaproteobacteria bacterium]PHR80125.1 MAG: stress response translation initiation inhibitor YciH [Colwellia sp.]
MKEKLSSLSDLAHAFGKDTVNITTVVKSDDQSLVYSTDSGRIKQVKTQPNITPSDGFAKIRRETKGRKGKGVVTITGLGLDSKALKELAKKLKKTCGTGGTVIGEIIEIQGDKREMIKASLEKAGFKVKVTGG